MNQSLAIVWDIVGQRGHSDVEGIKAGQGESRIDIAGAIIIGQHLFLGRSNTPLSGPAQGRLEKGLPQLDTQKYRIVVCGTGADLSRGRLIEHRVVGHGAHVTGKVSPIFENIQGTAEANIGRNLNFEVVDLIGEGRPHILVQA